MSYTYTDGVNPAKPAGSDAALVDNDMRAIKDAYNERLNDVLGVAWATDDPIKPTKVGPGISITGTGYQVTQPVTDLGNITGTVALDFNVRGNYVKATLTGNVTFTISNMLVGTTYVLFLAQDSTGGRTVSFPSSIRTAGSNALTLNTTGNRVSLLSITPYTSSIGLLALGGTGYNVS